MAIAGKVCLGLFTKDVSHSVTDAGLLNGSRRLLADPGRGGEAGVYFSWRTVATSSALTRMVLPEMSTNS